MSRTTRRPIFFLAILFAVTSIGGKNATDTLPRISNARIERAARPDGSYFWTLQLLIGKPLSDDASEASEMALRLDIPFRLKSKASFEDGSIKGGPELHFNKSKRILIIDLRLVRPRHRLFVVAVRENGGVLIERHFSDLIAQQLRSIQKHGNFPAEIIIDSDLFEFEGIENDTITVVHHGNRGNSQFSINVILSGDGALRVVNESLVRL